jgi:hypothetical protein
MKTKLLAAVCAVLAFNAFASGGSSTTSTAPNPLPTSAPAHGVVLRESFGAGPDNARPSGGKGTMKPVFASTSLGGFWCEWPGVPGNKNAAWTSSDPLTGNGAGWRFAASSLDWDETLPTPLQADPFNGTAISWWFDGVVANPAALVPFTAPASPYDLSVDLYPGVLAGARVSMGFTASGVLSDNLSSAGQLYLTLSQDAQLDGFNGLYELRVGGANGELLASGSTMLLGSTSSSCTSTRLRGRSARA